MEINDILVPSFVAVALAGQQCERCERSLCDAWVRSAGIRLDSDNNACFFALVWCSNCEKSRDFTFTNRKFAREDWWYDIASWSSDAARPDKVGTVLASIPLLTGCSILLRDAKRVRRLDVIGGYVGDAGPILFVYRRRYSARAPRPYGVARVEKRDRLTFLPHPHEQALPVSRWPWFAKLRGRASFTDRGKRWTKLGTDELRDIVVDRVFETATARP